jgi:hypothetical protein
MGSYSFDYASHDISIEQLALFTSLNANTPKEVATYARIVLGMAILQCARHMFLNTRGYGYYVVHIGVSGEGKADRRRNI